MSGSDPAAAVYADDRAGEGPIRGLRRRRWRRRRHDDPDGTDAGDDESQDGQAPLRHADADHGPDDGPDDGRRRRWRPRRHDGRRRFWRHDGWRRNPRRARRNDGWHGRRRHDGHARRRRRWRRDDEHDPAIDADGQFRRRPPASPKVILGHVSAGPISRTALRFGPHRVSTTLEAESRPSTAIEVAASLKKSAAVASCVVSHQPPLPMNNNRAVCASTGPNTLAAPCEDKYIDIASPMKAYIGAAVDRYCRLAARTPGSWVKMLTHRSGKTAIKLPTSPTEAKESRPAIQAMRRARAIRSAPTAMPIIGTDAIPPANATEASINSSRAPRPEPARISVPKPASIWVRMLMVSTDCSGERQDTAPTLRMST